MAILMKLAACHVRNAFKRPLRPNAPTVRVLTSVILKGIDWAFRKLYPTKIPGMVHQGLLAPQRLCAISLNTVDTESSVSPTDSSWSGHISFHQENMSVK